MIFLDLKNLDKFSFISVFRLTQTIYLKTNNSELEKYNAKSHKKKKS